MYFYQSFCCQFTSLFQSLFHKKFGKIGITTKEIVGHLMPWERTAVFNCNYVTSFIWNTWLDEETRLKVDALKEPLRDIQRLRDETTKKKCF